MSNGNIIIESNLVYLNISETWYVYDRSKEPIGIGAMGTVYYGFMCNTNIPVAIKQVKEEYANDRTIRNRARLEATLMFRHRNLVEMLGICEWEEDYGPIFIVSKYVRGCNLNVFVKEKLNMMPIRRRIKTICDMILPIFDALHYLHSSGILHMDIKPSNIMVENGNNIRLMDLGIAHTELHQYDKNSMMGTPKFAAPEQFGKFGTNEGVDNRTDIYELSVTIYELLCDNNPFTSETFMELIEKHKTLLLPYNKNIPKKIIDVLRKAAHPNKYLRYNNITEFKSDFIESIKTLNEPIKEDNNNRWTIILTLTLLLIAIIGLIIYLI